MRPITEALRNRIAYSLDKIYEESSKPCIQGWILSDFGRIAAECRKAIKAIEYKDLEIRSLQNDVETLEKRIEEMRLEAE